jgi:hypothetical protein
MRFSRLALIVVLALWSVRASAIVTFNVNSTDDHPDDIFNGVCADAFGNCTLRAAVMEANLGTSFTGYDIVLPAGTYTLMRGVTNPDDHSNGDLDITTNIVRIHGAGAAKTIIDANHLDRAFKVGANGVLRLFDLTIRYGQPSSFGGRSTFGGAILDQGILELSGCVLDSNAATAGGAVAALQAGFEGPAPNVTALNTTFSRNGAANGGGAFLGGNTTVAQIDASTFYLNNAHDGGAIFMQQAKLDLQNSTLYQNDVENLGGGIYGYRLTAHLYNVTLAGNGVDSDLDYNGAGGGIYFDESNNVTIWNSVFANLNDNTRELDDCGTISCTVTFAGTNILSTFAGCSTSLAAGAVLAETDPGIGGLGDFGGPTQTAMLLPGSSALNVGPLGGCAGISGTLTLDQRGVKRPIGAKCDLGAVEVEPVGDANGDGVVDLADVFYVINFLFAGGPVPLGRANVDGNASIDVADVFFLINYLFAGGPAPV